MTGIFLPVSGEGEMKFEGPIINYSDASWRQDAWFLRKYIRSSDARTHFRKLPLVSSARYRRELCGSSERDYDSSPSITLSVRLQEMSTLSVCAQFVVH